MNSRKIDDHLAFDQKKGYLALIIELLPTRRLPPVAPGFSTPATMEVIGTEGRSSFLRGGTKSLRAVV
jgi:hypothetical protein